MTLFLLGAFLVLAEIFTQYTWLNFKDLVGNGILKNRVVRKKYTLFRKKSVYFSHFGGKNGIFSEKNAQLKNLFPTRSAKLL